MSGLDQSELGPMSGKARAMASEFQRAVEKAADDRGMKKINNSVQAAGNPAKFGTEKLRETTGILDKPTPALAHLSENRQTEKYKTAVSAARSSEKRHSPEMAIATSGEPEPIKPPAASVFVAVAEAFTLEAASRATPEDNAAAKSLAFVVPIAGTTSKSPANPQT
jgi:sec-independent protein translocase protein TatB